MPSPKSVLRDIHDLKLDPNAKHSGTKASGRLKHSVVTPVTAPDAEPVKVAPRVEEKKSEPVKPVVEQVKEEVIQEAADVPVTNEVVEPKADEPVDTSNVEEPVADDKPKKKAKKEKFVKPTE